MATFSFSLPALYEQYFGTRPEPYQFDEQPQRPRLSKTGAPLYSIDQFGREYFLPIWIDGYEMPYPCLSVRTRKILVETQMTECDGTVKELVSTGDYEFLIRGFVIGKDGRWPEEHIADLRALYSRREALTMTSAMSNIFLFDERRKGYDKVVITDLDFPEYRGVEAVKPYHMRLVSDSPINLIEKV